MRSHVDCTDLGIWINVLPPFSRKRDLLGSFATVQERQKVSMEDDRFAPAGRWVSELSSYEMSYGSYERARFHFLNIRSVGRHLSLVAPRLCADSVSLSAAMPIVSEETLL